jgi:YbbR domain-containing protein
MTMKLPEILSRDWIIKLASILLAGVVWTMVQGEVTVQKAFEGVKYQLNLAPSMVITKAEVKTFRVVVSGPQDVIRDLKKNSIKISHGLKGVQTPGVVLFSIAKEDIIVPSRVQILSVSPRKLSVTLDKVVEKEVRVNVEFEGRPEEGLQMKDHVVNPTVVRIKGPEHILNGLKEIATDAIWLSGRTRSFVQTVSLKRIFDEDQNQELPHVDVFVKIEPKDMKTTLENVPVAVLQGKSLDSSVSISKSRVQVVLEGPESLVSKIRSSDMKAYVDVTDLKPGKYQLPVSFIPVQGANILEIKPAVVEIEIKRKLEGVS